VRVAHNIGVPKDFVLKFDAVRVTLGCSSCSNIQNEVAPSPEDLLKFGPNRVAGVLRHGFHFFVHKNRDALIDAKLGLALATLDGRRRLVGGQNHSAGRRGSKSGVEELPLTSERRA